MSGAWDTIPANIREAYEATLDEITKEMVAAKKIETQAKDAEHKAKLEGLVKSAALADSRERIRARLGLR
jgi:hypothetical protein